MDILQITDLQKRFGDKEVLKGVNLSVPEKSIFGFIGQNGAGKEVYEAISPIICLWPTTEWLWNNDSGTGYDSGPWKTIETREWINEIGVEQNYIEKDGDVTLVLTKDGITKRD